MTEADMSGSLNEKIAASAGASYFNRIHQRSFSFNIFKMNSVDLIEAVTRIKDPEQSLLLMMEKNREAGRQAHRELNRYVHNFVSSALTLVEHTRVFMRSNYAESAMLTKYESEIKSRFTRSPVVQFVQGLRNYMLHKGLPDSSMFVHFTANPDKADGSSTMETGVQYDTASLLEWEKWPAAARLYLQKAGPNLDVQQFVQEYLKEIEEFSGWLDVALEEYHQSDLIELRQLESQLETSSPFKEVSSPLPMQATEKYQTEYFHFNFSHKAEIETLSNQIVDKIGEINFEKTTQEFRSDRPTFLVNNSNIVGNIVLWGRQTSGDRAIAFIQREGILFGLSESDYGHFKDLAQCVLKAEWARSTLGLKFIEDEFLDWARKMFEGLEAGSFADTLSVAARNHVAEVEVWAPIAHLEVEEAFDFGPVRIEPVTNALMDYIRDRAPKARSDQEQDVNLLFEKIRSEIQGYAALRIVIKSEFGYAQEKAMVIAEDAVGLLRFLSPTAAVASVFSAVALKGAEYVPLMKVIMISESSLRFVEGLLPEKVGRWRISAEQIVFLSTGLMQATCSLLIPQDLNEFALTVRSSILVYSAGMTLVNPMDRIRNCLSAIEIILLHHDVEPRMHSIANRAGFLLSRQRARRITIAQTFRQIYWMQYQPQTFLRGSRHVEIMNEFMSYAHAILRVALIAVKNFQSKSEFISEIDNMSNMKE